MMIAFEHAAEKFALNPIQIGWRRRDEVRLNGDHIADPADPQADMFFATAHDNIAMASSI
jgi:hypothetical protein